jgi:type II secretory pathway pseudopilin PulG
MRKNSESTKGKTGFTLIEVEVAIVLIVFAMSGLGLVTLTGLTQLQVMETAAPLQVFVTPDNSVAVTGVIYSAQHPHIDNNHLDVTAVDVYASSITFTTTVTSSSTATSS